MKRFIVCFLLSACIMAGVFAQEQRNFVIDVPYDIYGYEVRTKWAFTEGNRLIRQAYNVYGEKETAAEGRYTVEYESGVPFLSIVWDDNRRERYLLLWYNSYTFILYDSDSNCFMAEPEGIEHYMSDPMAGATDMSATSSLTEGAAVYSPDISNLAIGKPWVEGVDGYGIGEKISMDTKSLWGAYALYISIEFVSYSNPQLYRLNSRPSKIRVYRGSISFDVDLEDTPHFQKIQLPGRPRWVAGVELSEEEWYDPETDTVIENPDFIQIEILDVYPGTRWQDTAINAIFYATSTWQ